MGVAVLFMKHWGLILLLHAGLVICIYIILLHCYSLKSIYITLITFFTHFVTFLRLLKNEETGIDITVPEFKEVSGRFGLSKEEEFNIIVISRLAYFKTESHFPGDVVQFMVSPKHLPSKQEQFVCFTSATFKCQQSVRKICSIAIFVQGLKLISNEQNYTKQVCNNIKSLSMLLAHNLLIIPWVCS